MTNIEIKHYKVLSLPKKLVPNVVYYLLDQKTGKVKGYITDITGAPVPLTNFDAKNGLTYADIENLEVLVEPLEFNFIDQLSISITHNLNRITIITVLDVVGNEILTDIFHHSTLNEVTVSFGLPISGKIIIR
jgi:hypothetical protein